MTHARKVDRLVADLSARGLDAAAVAPPFFRLLWSMGARVPPPMFVGFAALALTLGGLLGIGPLVVLWALDEGPRSTSPVLAAAEIVAVVAPGFLVAIALGVYYRWLARGLDLPAWAAYAGAAAPPGPFDPSRMPWRLRLALMAPLLVPLGLLLLPTRPRTIRRARRSG